LKKNTTILPSICEASKPLHDSRLILEKHFSEKDLSIFNVISAKLWQIRQREGEYIVHIHERKYNWISNANYIYRRILHDVPISVKIIQYIK